MKTVREQLNEYNKANPRPAPTPVEVKRFFEGMKYASRIAQSTQKGYIAANAINKEARTLCLFAEQKNLK